MELEKFAPLFEKLQFDEGERYLVSPFFTNLDKSVFAVTFLPPEVIGALCSRTSRAKADLRAVFLKEFVKPFIEKESEYGKSLKKLIDFLHENPFEVIFSNPKGREFYIKWLAQYGDDSIAQMAGSHLAYAGLSQVAIKHFEDMRIGIAPIEKSTRYVDYGTKIEGQYRYYTDPTLESMGLKSDFKKVMDNLFGTYQKLSLAFLDHLKRKYPGEEELALKTKVFDTLRGMLPTATLSQVAFFANGQAFEYFVARSLDHKLGEIRWAGRAGLEELKKVIPAFLRRADDPASQEYRTYLSDRSKRVNKALEHVAWERQTVPSGSGARLLEYDADGEDKIIASLLYGELKEPFEKILHKVKNLSGAEKASILQEVLKDRKARWYRMPRAFENTYLRFEITMNIGGWRDLHRHRMLTQFRERFHVDNGFDVPDELREAGLDNTFAGAIEQVNDVFKKIEQKDKDLAQYCCTLAHRVRFIQYQNLRSFFWEAELRTISQGHPDYRKIEHQKVRLVQKIYPLIGKYILADMADYDFARRKVNDQIQKKEEELKQYFGKKPE